MVIKTKEFDRQLSRDVSWITINRKLPLWQKGSYKIKEWGDTISDIDFQARVYLTPQLINIITGVIRKNSRPSSPFMFIHMSVGKYKEYEVPWTIDEHGGCDFDLKRAHDWLDWFIEQNLVPQSTISYITSKLYSESMKIRDLIDVENVLHPYAEIIWRLEDINRGFVERDGHRYYLLDQMKKETPVMEYIYRYKGDGYVAIDVGLVDKKYKTGPTEKMYRYYTDDWYKIMKSFRWKLNEDDKPGYFAAMRQVDDLISLKYTIGLIQKLEKHKLLPRNERVKMVLNVYKGLDKIINEEYKYDDHIREVIRELGNYNEISFPELGNFMYEKINHILKKYVLYYASKLKDGDRETALLYLHRGVESQIPTSQETIKSRSNVGVKCPFFSTSMDDLEKLMGLAVRMDLPHEKIIDCFSQVSTQLGLSVTDIIQEVVGDNNLSIVSGSDGVIFREHGIEKGVYLHDDKDALRAYILLSSYPN